MNRKSVLVHAESIDFSNPNDIIAPYGFKKTRCNKFITNDKKQVENIKICFCGLPLERHDQQVIKAYLNSDSNYPTEWNYKEHTTNDEETDAYGEFINNDSKRHTSKYLRIDFRTDVKKIAEVLFEAWKLHKPKLLISVTGGAKNFKMKFNIKNAFKKAIINAAITTDAWLVTGGTEEGIMKVIGEAFRESTIRLGDRRKLVLLGIANWTTIKNNHLLIRKNDGEINNYNRNEEEYKNHSDYTYIEKDKGAYLDSNHTHFLLVDKAELNSYGGEIDFSTSLIDFICDPNSDDTNEIPVVVLVVGGGPNTLKVVLSSCKTGSPCLFIDIQGSDGSSNILAYVYRMIEEKLSKLGIEPIPNDLIDKTLEEDIFTKCKNIWNKKDDEIKEMIKTILEIFQPKNFHLLNAFTIESTKQTNEMDEAILHAILKAKKNNKKKDLLDNLDEEEETQEKSLLVSQLKLALEWDRIDVAKKYILENDLMNIYLLKEPMYIAINKDRPDFVQDFLEYGLKLPNFLTYRVLLRLYNDVSRNSAFYNLFKRNKFGKYFSFFNKKKTFDIRIRFKDVGLIIKQLLDNFYENEYLNEPYDCLTSKILNQSNEYGQTNKDIEKSILFFRHELIRMDDICDKPETHLFIYAILTNKPKLAKVILNEGRNELIGCLFASKIFKAYALLEESDRKTYEDLALEFENIAVNLLDRLYKKDLKKSQLLLMRTIPEYDNTTCLQLAKLAKDLNFLSHPCVQQLLVKIWYGKLSKNTRFLRISLSLLFPLAAPLIFLYNQKSNYETNDEDHDDDNHKSQKDNLNYEESTRINRIDFDQFNKKENYFERLYSFSQAPIIKFLYDKIFYLMFLLNFSYVICCDFYNLNESDKSKTTGLIKISGFEVLLIIWVYSILIDKLHSLYVIDSKIFLTKCKFFLFNLWNGVYAVAILLFTIGMILRFIPECPSCFSTARIILSLDLLFWMFNFLHTYTSIKLMGPKLIMIKEMFSELITFVFIVLAFLMGFGVATQALSYHNIPVSLDLLKRVFFPSFFIIPQEYYTRDSLLFASECKLNQTDRYLTDEYSMDDCADYEGSQVALVIYIVYAVFISILMVNLLIAIFSNSISQVENESDKIWRFQRYSLIYEYFHKPLLVPPFNVFYLLGYLIKLIALPLRKRVFSQREKKSSFLEKLPKILSSIILKFSYRYTNGFKVNIKEKNLEKRLVDWENRTFHQLVKNEIRLENEKIENRLQESLEKYEYLIQKCNSILLNTKETYGKVYNISKLIEEIQILRRPSKK